MSPKSGHLNHDLLARAIARPDTLAGDVARHLEHCPQCSRALHALEQNLTNIGNMARIHAPTLERRITVPALEPQTHAHPWGWRLAFGSAVAGVALALFVGYGHWVAPSLDNNPTALAREMGSDAGLMSEVAVLIENPTDQRWGNLGARGTVADDDFMDFAAPVGTDEEVS